MTLLQPSFRGRLRLFFAVIVVVPMIAVGVVLFQLLDAADNSSSTATLAQAQNGGAEPVRAASARTAMAAARPMQDDVGAGDGDQRRGRGGGAASGWSELARRIGAQLDRARSSTGSGASRPATPTAIAAAPAQLQDSNGRPIGRITVSMTTARGLRGRGAAAARGRGARRSRRRGAGDDAARRAATVRLPDEPGADVDDRRRATTATTRFTARGARRAADDDGAAVRAGAAAGRRRRDDRRDRR